ncbi:MAG: 2,3-dihydroxyphenylpropionate/2,3-dihydroxicinnamic acid 1,2-dioxygenase [Burkholderiaceae bacterium]|nr:2,3-dihydroxyphenylpropionate/2,3-dihydroxicinnamic acid 1,2-dioxygenase [Burkholderiaceae bacterium]
MAEIVFAAGVPHAPGLIGLLDAAPADIQSVIHRMYADLRTALLAARPDVLIIFGNDHLANSRPRAYPDFLIGMAPVHSGPYEWYREWLGCRNYQVKGNPAVAEALFRGFNRRGHRMHAQRENLRFDDNVSIPSLHLRLDETDITVVPVLQNCTVPPLPQTDQCYAIGQSLADVIANDMPAGLRVALLGSGGLSHEPGGARYWYIDKDFDLWFMELMASGDHAKMLADLTVARMEQSGSGGTLEVMAWVIVAGAIGPRYGTQSDYALHTNFKCGIGAVLWDLTRQVGQPLAVRDPGPVTTEPTLLTAFDPSLASHDLVQDLKWDPALRARFATHEAEILDRYALRPDERQAIERRDFRSLYDIGFHPYLGGQLARLIYGNTAGKGANFAVQKLVDSLRGQAADSFAADEGVTAKA